MEVIAHLLLKVATSGPFRCKKTSKMSIFEAITQRKNEVVRSIYVFWKILEPSNLVQLHIFWKRVHTFHWKEPPVDFLELREWQKRSSLTKPVDVFMLTF